MYESLQVQCINGFLSREILLNQQSTWIKLTAGQRQSQRCLSGLETVPGPLSVPVVCRLQQVLKIPSYTLHAISFVCQKQGS